MVTFLTVISLVVSVASLVLAIRQELRGSDKHQDLISGLLYGVVPHIEARTSTKYINISTTQPLEPVGDVHKLIN